MTDVNKSRANKALRCIVVRAVLSSARTRKNASGGSLRADLEGARSLLTRSQTFPFFTGFKEILDICDPINSSEKP